MDSSTASIQPDTSRSFDQEIEHDDRLRCLFSQSIVTVETRATVDRQAEELNPVNYCVDLDQKLKHFKDNFDQTRVREEFLRTQAAENSTTTTMTTRLLANMDLSLMDDIPVTHVKTWREFLICNKRYSIPMIETAFLTKYTSVFSTVVELQIDQIIIDQSLQGVKIDKELTLVKTRELAEAKQRGFARDPARTSLNILIVQALILTLIRKDTFEQLKAFLVSRTVLRDELTGGMFIKMDQDPAYDNETSMIRSDSIGIELKVIYNLNFRQIQSLIKFLFSNDKFERLESKIDLLSSVRGEIRNDIALDPGRVLEHVIREHFMTRLEITELIFRHQDKQSNTISYRCPTCKTTLGLATANNIMHNKCKVISWLVTKLGYKYEGNILYIESYNYVTPGVARYAKEAYQLRARLQNEPFYGRNDSEFVAYTIDDRGRPVKAAHQGIKTVKLDTSPRKH